MKKYMPVLVASGILLLSFQNCSQKGSNLQAGSNTPAQTKIEDPVLSQAQSLDILTQGDQHVSLNLQTGELVQNVGGVEVKKCLPVSMQAEILDVLASSNLCESAQPGPDMLCAQIYSAPYGEIHWADKSVIVGEAYSSCHKGVDLCGQDGMLLRGLLRDVVSRWNEWSCDFKVVAQ
jgi:hypothetical protein